MQNLISHTGRITFWVLSLAIALVSWRFLILGVEASMPFMVQHLEPRAFAFYAHVGLAPVALALAPFQLWSRLRAARPVLHRWVGRIYVLAIAISGAGGFVIGLGTDAGAVASAGFVVLAVIWLATTGLGIWHALNRDFRAHRRWMLRSVALTFAAVTLRIYLPVLEMTVGFEVGYPLVAWLAWVPNLIVMEIWLRRGTAVARA